MFSEQRRREEQALLAQDYALEQAEEKGLERGLERGRAEGLERGRAEGVEQGLERGKVEGRVFAFLDIVRQGLLPSEVASQQLGMTVAEFEALLSIKQKWTCYRTRQHVLFRGQTYLSEVYTLFFQFIKKQYPKRIIIEELNMH